MKSEGLIRRAASNSFGSERENDLVHDPGCKPSRGNLPYGNAEVREDGENGKIPKNAGNTGSEEVRLDGENGKIPDIAGNIECEEVKEGKENGRITENGANVVNIKSEDEHHCPASDFEEDMDISPPALEFSVELTETVTITEHGMSSEIHAENGCATPREGNSLSNHKKDIASARSPEINASALSGTKRMRASIDEQQPSVHVIYNSLTRESRRKLEELLQLWSQWHAQHCNSSNDSNEVLESGEEMYFPALHVGLDKASAVPFWSDNQTKNPLSKEFIPLDGKSVPLYDRGFSFSLSFGYGTSDLERGLEVVNASRCFNCGSYSHSLKDCPRPRDNVAVSNARKQQKSRQNQNPSSRNPTRYYQNSPGGKFDGLKPGALESGTRQLLGLGELDPPPWLNRMREIGYPPGYLEQEEDDQPSGITIFADEEIKEETGGKILDAACPQPSKKMSVQFPGINAPLPENADRRRWEAGNSTFNHSRNHSYRRYDHSLESMSRGHYDQMWSKDNRDDRPLGCDLPSRLHRYDSYGSGYLPGSPSWNSLGRRSPIFERSLSDRTTRSPLTHFDYSDRGFYGSLP